MPAGISNRSNLVNIDVFSGEFRISGRISVKTGGLLAVLANSATDFLELEEAYISRINKPGEIVASYNLCALRKDNISFILLRDRRDGSSTGSQPGRYNRGRPVESFLTVPAFEIYGEMLLDGKLSPSNLLAQSASRYQFVYGATASAASYPDIAYEGDLILVDTNQIGIVCLKQR